MINKENRKMKLILKMILSLSLTAVTLYGAAGKNNKIKIKDAGWYLRTVATATTQDGTVYAHKTAGVFGRITGSVYKKDIHDIAAYGENDAIFQVIFPQNNWDEENGNYFSDYRGYYKRQALDKRTVWTFLIRNPRSVNLADADLSIKLEGPYKITSFTQNRSIEYKESPSADMTELLSNLTLIDVDNQREYSYDELKDLNLGMDGLHTRTFRWVVGRVKTRDFNPWVPAE
jgi:hypothetical protein